MKKFFQYLVAAATVIPTTFLNATVTLDGHSATPEQIAAIAGGEQLVVTPVAMKRAEDAFRALCKAAGEGQMIYGLTVGVGLNKDRKFVDAKGELTQEVIDASSKFQTGLIRAHSGSVGPDMDIRTARATMAARLNMMLVGGAAVQIPVLEVYVNFLNKGVTPCMPSDGSMGEADITICSHVGQAMIGEGEAYYKGQKIPTAEALKAIGMKPVKLFGKDALAILSSNACSVGMGRLALTDMAQLQKVNTIAFALSYRDSVFTIGEVNRAYEAARFLFTVQLNSITSALRTTKLGTPDFTGGLERYLGTPKSYHAFGAMEKPPVTLAMENKVLSTPVSCDFLPVAGQVEDVATNAPMVVERLHKQIENSFTLLGIEMIHATQAVDLRHQKQPDYALSPATEKLYKAIRAKVQMLDEDRAMTNDFRSAAEVMRTFQP